MSKNNQLKIGISLGDLNGIGPEVIIKTLADNRILEGVIPIIYGSGKVLSFYRKVLDTEFHYFNTNDIDRLNPKKVNVINVWDEVVDLQPGQITPEGGKYALKSLEAAVADLKSGKIHALVTAPIHKKNIHEAGFNFPGHTEYLASQFENQEHLMLMKTEGLAIATVTGHIPLNQVSATLTKELIVKKAKILSQSLKADFGLSKPRIAIMGLNPHAGEDGILGQEENEIVIPAINELRNNNMLVYGPFPADGFFGVGHHLKFDGVLSMYHDQGLIPFKIYGFEQGVNYTAGLPVVRTSPDHGTAFDLAGRNLADESSFRAAFFMAKDISRSRQPELAEVDQ